jgi:SAM-dependent methyltransferase
MNLDETIRREQTAWASADSLEFYQTHRRRPDELYESERYFLPDVVRQVQSMLDVGCAAGGFSQIVRELNPAVRYVGVDVIPYFVALAQRDYPGVEFHVSDGLHFPFAPGTFDLVHSSGVLHLNSHYREMVQAMWTQTSRYLLIDFRLTRTPTVIGEMDVNFGASASSATRLPYHILNVDELVAFLAALDPAPASIRAKGYRHTVSPTAHVHLESAIMAFFLLEKGDARPTQIELDLDRSR